MTIAFEMEVLRTRRVPISEECPVRLYILSGAIITRARSFADRRNRPAKRAIC